MGSARPAADDGSGRQEGRPVETDRRHPWGSKNALLGAGGLLVALVARGDAARADGDTGLAQELTNPVGLPRPGAASESRP